MLINPESSIEIHLSEIRNHRGCMRTQQAVDATIVSLYELQTQ